jgi:hypothetical protein
MLMHAKESKQMTRVRWYVFTTHGPRAEHVQFVAISDRSVMALRTQLVHTECGEMANGVPLC